MIVFLVSLRSKESSKNWDFDEKMFNNTLRSIFNQTCDEFLVYVGCNARPKLYDNDGKPVEYDSRLRFVEKNMPVPVSHREKCRDRAWKLLYCAQELRKKFDEYAENGHLYVMLVDADDYVNCNIAQYCKDNPEKHGFKSALGYKYSYGNRLLIKTPYFGGTMNIMSLTKEELPDNMPTESEFYDIELAGCLNTVYPVAWTDHEIEGKFKNMGRPFERLPFKSTIYVVDTGSNISQQEAKRIREGSIGKKHRRIHFGVILKKLNIFQYKYLSKGVKREFGMS